MSYADLSNYSEVLKTYYLPAIQDQLNHENFLSAKIETNEEDVSGKDATIECRYGRSGGTGARADYGSLPTPDYQKFKTMTVPTKRNYGRVIFSGPTIAATRDEKGSYARVIDTEITGIADDLKKETNRQYWGCGYGILGRWYSGATSNQLLQRRYTGNTIKPTGAFGSTFGGKYLTENGHAYWCNPTMSSGCTLWATQATDVVVTGVTRGTYTDTLANTDPAGGTEAAGSFLARRGNITNEDNVSSQTYATFTGNIHEMMGLAGIVSDTNLDDVAWRGSGSSNIGFDGSDTHALQNLDIGTYTWWKANMDTHVSGRYAGQRALTLKMIQKMFDTVEIKAGKDYGPDVILMPHALRREYLELCLADRRAVNTMELDGGFTALDYNGVPIMVDIDAIDGEIHFLTMKDLAIYRMSDYDWMDRDGAILQRVSNVDAYEATLFRYAELGCKRRNSQGVICDLAYEDPA